MFKDYVRPTNICGIPITEEDEHLNKKLSLPSLTHGYSLMVEFAKDWFLAGFNNPKYFKTVFVNGKHCFDDFRRFNIETTIKREKPAVAITPIINYEYDREKQDSYMAPMNLLLKGYNYRESTFKDFDNNIFLGVNLRQQEIAVQYKVRVETRAQQMDVYRIMEMAFRIGYSHNLWISADFHIPMEVILNIAQAAHFKIDSKNHVENIVAFVAYLNAHSDIPIVYKLRAVNGNSEFFFRVPSIHTHIIMSDKLSADDGETEGMMTSNFHVEMSCILRMNVPHFYSLTSKEQWINYAPTAASNNSIGLYDIVVINPEKTNLDGWELFFTSDYIFDETEKGAENLEISLKDILSGEDMQFIIEWHYKQRLSPTVFLDILVYNTEIKYEIDWEKIAIIIPKVTDKQFAFSIYLNKEYYNNQLAMMREYNSSRIS